MSLYEECVSLTNGPHISHEEAPNSIALTDISERTNLHVTIPSFIGNEQANRKGRDVYYISDLHLVNHVIRYFKETVSEDCIRAYIHKIVMQLFDGEFGNAIKEFNTPIVLFGGDISSSFTLAEVFYRDFLTTWERVADEQYDFYCKEFSQMREELDSTKKLFEEWKESHPWIKKARKPLEEYSERKVPRKIKELNSRISELTHQICGKRGELGLSYNWESDYKRTRKHPYVYTILGNHELWDFDSYDTCETTYSDLFEELNIVFLNNRISSLGVYREPWQRNYNPETRTVTYSLLKREDDPKEYEQQLFYMENMLIVGGLGFASMNFSFNAEQGIYGKAVNREEELKRCEEWRMKFSKALKIAEQNHCSLVVLSHNPISDWLPQQEECSNCFIFSGHTHRNIVHFGENNTFIFSDNQVGYSGKKFSFKKAKLHIPRNPFASDADGFREITCDEYKEYYSYVCEALPGTGVIERHIKLYEAKLFVLKQDGYVGFFLVAPQGIYICNGGQIRKIGSYEPLDRYMTNFIPMVNNYIRTLSPLRRAQEQLSTYIKSFGGCGTIHGTIVDIDFENHIMVNVYDGTLTFYNSPMFGIVKTYSDIGALLHAHCPELEADYQKISNAKLIPVSKSLSESSSSYEVVDIKKSPYVLSRRINALQRLFDKRILRDWNPNLEFEQIQD